MKNNTLLFLKKTVDSFVALENDLTAKSEVLLYNIVVSHIHELCIKILRCEELGIDKNTICEILSPAVHIHGKSPFINRLQVWPQGYPGDFESIEYLFAAKNKSPYGTIEYFCEKYALNCSVAQQHRNKLYQQSQKTIEKVKSCNRARVLSLGCGSCIDIQALIPFVSGCDFEFVLNDLDQAAIAAAKNKIKAINSNCLFIQGNAINIVRRPFSLGKFDLVLAGGLFDYLPDKHVIFFIKNIYHKLLNPGGELFFTNIAKGNPYRPWIEYLANWILIERSEQDIQSLIKNACINTDCLSIERDKTDMTCLAELVKNEKI